MAKLFEITRSYQHVTEKLELLRAADVLMMDSFVDYLEQNLIIEGKSWNKTQANNLDDDKLKYNRDYEESIKLYEKYSMLPFNFHLIFRTNGNELKEETDTNNSIWKQYCHDQGPTLTVIRTKNINDDEVVFGGFKSVSWSNREDENVGGGGKGFIFGYLWQDDKLLLPWMLPVENHFHGDRILGDGQLLYIDFTNGNQLLAHANGWNLEATIEELEVFKVVRKNV
nr:13832_t:CDS:2 [Entrophospora candida]